jgi:uncharacterized protein YyaL (SSP411 family)
MRLGLASVLACSLALGACSLMLGACAHRNADRTDATVAARGTEGVEWRVWEREAFEVAQVERRILLINVVATWCHWCHVMEETTYADPEVAAILREHFVTIRVDSDARPDLAERYRAWGWPATAVLTPDARTVVNLRGYRKPKVFAAFLRELVAERDAGTLGPREAPPAEGRAPSPSLDAVRAIAVAQLDGFWDDDQAGWGGPQKYPWPAPIEHALVRARVRGETEWHDRALRTLKAQRALIDPVDGGMYQYSVGGVWTRPHFEKIAMIQAGAIETYALAARATGDETWLDAARDVARFVLGPMQDPDGGFHTSQDADLRREGQEAVPGAQYYALPAEQRRALGTPRIDTAVYADLNGLTIHALVELHAAGGDEAARDAAIRAGERLLATHRTSEGAFLHAESDDPRGLLHLADQAAMGRALLSLHDLTGDARWLHAATRLADFVLAELRDPAGGFFAHTEDPAAVGVFAERRKPLEENGTCARFLLELDRRLHLDPEEASPYRDAATKAIATLGTTARLRPEGKVVARFLLAAELLGAATVDVTVVGEPGDPAASALLRTARRIHEPRALVEESRPGERYPDTGRAAVYLCTDTACSTPITDPDRLPRAAEAFFATNLGP